MGGRAERRAVQCQVRIGEPQHRDGGAPRDQHLRAKALRHGTVAVEIVPDGERIRAADRDAARRIGAGAVVDVAEMLGVEEIGRAGRDVREGDEAAGRGDTFRQRRHTQRGAGRPPHMRTEIGYPRIAHDDPALLDQAHPIAVETVAAGMAAGGNRCRRDAGHGREHRAVLGAPQALVGKRVERGRQRCGHPVAAEAVAVDVDGERGGAGVVGAIIVHGRACHLGLLVLDRISMRPRL